MMLTSGRLCRIAARGTPCPPKRRVRFARRRTPQESLFGIHAKLQLIGGTWAGKMMRHETTTLNRTHLLVYAYPKVSVHDIE